MSAGRSPGPGLFRWLFWATALALLWLALGPGSPAQSNWFWQADKVRHAAAFATLWLIGVRARLASPLALALGLVAFGGAIEVAQSFTPDRDASWLDLLADSVGITLGWRLQRQAA